MKATHITGNTCSVLHEGHRKAYENSEAGRAALLAECAGCENLGEVLAAWGDEPTVILAPEAGETTGAKPGMEERIAQLEERNAMLTECLLEMSELVYA